MNSNINPSKNDVVKEPIDTYTAIQTPKDVKIETKSVETTSISTKEPSKSIPLYQLYRFATPLDYLLLFFGLIGSIINGACFPLLAILFGDAIQYLYPYNSKKVNETSIYFFLIAWVLFLSGYFSYYFFQITGKRQINKLRHAFLHQMLYREISFYDHKEAQEMISRITGDTIKIEEGLGEKLGEAIKFLAQFISGYIIGFIRGWKMSFVMMAVMPGMVISLAWLMTKLKQSASYSQKLYAEAGAVAEETISSMRTVISLNAETYSIEKYETKVSEVEKENLLASKYIAFAFSWFMASIWVTYAIGLWYGGKLVSDGDKDTASPRDVFSAFYAILMGTIALGQISPNATAVANAKGAATEIFTILESSSQIDASKEVEGKIPEKCEGKIEAVNINFSYPTRSEIRVLKNYNLTIEPRQTLALVGPSGGGKSTIINLIERFYDPTEGTMFLDGIDMKQLNLKWLRSQIGLVSQEPILFSGTIYENIAAGCVIGEVTPAMVSEAAIAANVHSLIMQLPKQYKTIVGERGVALSGGQKQRIAIARALIRKPKILLLDEATSALDTGNERIVQQALDNLIANGNMTCIVIAHRLSTIRNANKIVVVSQGEVQEQGTHDELMKIENGIYKGLVNSQYKVKNETERIETETLSMEKAVVSKDGVTLMTMMDHTESTGQNVVVTTRATKWLRNLWVPVEKLIMNMKNILGAGGAQQTVIQRIFQLNRPEKNMVITGVVAAGLIGFSYPSNALLITEILTSMTTQFQHYQQTKDRKYLSKLYNDISIDALVYVGAAGLLFFISFAQSYSFKYTAEKLTTRLRNLHFKAMCRQNIAFFDEEKHSTGALASDLNIHATKVVLIAGESQGRLLQAIFTCLAALIVSFVLGSWLLTLVMLAIFPMLVVGAFIRTASMRKGFGAGAEDLADSTACATEALSNMRTVAAYGLEERTKHRYNELLILPLKKMNREAHVNGLAQGFSSFSMFAAYALVFWYGGRLIHKHDITFTELMRTLMAIMMSSMGVGQAVGFLGDTDVSKRSATEIFELIDKPIEIDAFSTAGEELATMQGKLDFHNIDFAYPTRSHIPVLRNYTLSILPGQIVAFCGQSGCGKSTIVSLLERFYNPTSGQILIDDVPIENLNLRWLRDQIGYVGQEPMLFDTTIRENIILGLGLKRADLSLEIIKKRLIEATKMANAHDFILQFPDGYNTRVGSKGSQLSGGQKQRIAIARAMIKQPKILLLDEATSALDSENEVVVQRSLDNLIATSKCTTIIIAHRLSTIRHADQICAIDQGQVVEKGTHEELLKIDGIYANLVRRQLTK